MFVWVVRQFRRMMHRGKKIKQTEDTAKKCHRPLSANELMHDYEKEVFGWWGGDRKKADAMSASEIQEKWEEHQRKLRKIGFL